MTIERRALALALALAQFSGCDNEVEGNAYAPDYLPGTHTVWVGRRLESYAVLSTNLETAYVQDVHHDAWGDYVTVRIRWSGVPTYHPVQGCSDCMPDLGSAGAGSEGFYVQSTDGATWRPLDLSNGWLSGLPMGLFRARNGLDALVVGASGHRGVGNAFYPDWYAQRVDLRADALVTDPAFDGMPLYDPRVVASDHVAGVYRDSADYILGASAMTTLDAWSLLLADGVRDLRDTPGGVFRSADGATFTAYSDVFRRFHDGGSSMDICRVDVAMAGDHLPRVECRGIAAFPPPYSEGNQMTHVTHDRVMRLASDGRRTWAVEIVPAEEAPRTYDLGPGELAPQQRGTWGYDLRERYGPLVRLRQPDGTDRFVDLLADGTVQERRFPPSPCRNDCGADIAWITPLGGDEWRVFYTVSDLSAAHAPLIVVRDVTVPPSAPGESPDDPTTSPLPGYPNAVPAGGLERACLAMSSCHATLRTDACVLVWSGVHGPSAERFVAAADQGCAALDEAWRAPALLGQPCPPLDDWCVGDVMVTRCSGGTIGSITQVEDCAILGTTCSSEGMGSARAACTDGSVPPDELACDSCTAAGNAVQCVIAGGQWYPRVEDCALRGGHCARVPSAVCVDDGVCASDGATCEGDTMVACANGTRTETYCPDWGDTCHLGEGGRVLGCDAATEIECTTQTFRMACVGTVAAWCNAARSVHWVDCRALGFSGCEDVGGMPHCTP